jgi:hypothetical protein
MSTSASTVPALSSKPKRKNRRDIEVVNVEHLSWAPSNIIASLDAVLAFTERQAQNAINWYYTKKRPKALLSRLLRLFAIAFATAGGLIPIVTSLPFIKQGWVLEKWGFVALGLAAACIGLDKFFGVSSGWIRYITTAQTLQNDLSTFQLDWARLMSKVAGSPPTSSQVEELLQLARDFSSRMMQSVTQETQQWVAEFQGSIADLERTTKAQLESARPGSLTVTVDNAGLSDQPVTVDVDGVSYGTMAGNTWAIRQLAPGTHTVLVSGRKDQKKLQEAATVVVPAAGTARLDLKFPIVEQISKQASGGQ